MSEKRPRQHPHLPRSPRGASSLQVVAVVVSAALFLLAMVALAALVLRS